MPKIIWDDLPPALRDHLFERALERKIAFRDLARLEAWRRTLPDAPDGPWFKDFGSFRLCGDGAYPKTFLLQGQAVRGKPID